MLGYVIVKATALFFLFLTLCFLWTVYGVAAIEWRRWWLR